MKKTTGQGIPTFYFMTIHLLTELSARTLQYLLKKITTSDHPQYSLVLGTSDFCHFLKPKGILKGTCLEEIDGFTANSMDLLKKHLKREIS